MPKTRSHLHAGAFAPEREARADREDAAHELHHQQTIGGGVKLSLQDRLDMRYATARGVRRKAANQPRRYQSRSRTRQHDQQKTFQCRAVRAGDQRIAQKVCPLQREPEQCSHHPRRCASWEREQRKGQEAPLAVPAVCGFSTVILHLRTFIVLR